MSGIQSMQRRLVDEVARKGHDLRLQGVAHPHDLFEKRLADPARKVQVGEMDDRQSFPVPAASGARRDRARSGPIAGSRCPADGRSRGADDRASAGHGSCARLRLRWKRRIFETSCSAASIAGARRELPPRSASIRPSNSPRPECPPRHGSGRREHPPRHQRRQVEPATAITTASGGAQRARERTTSSSFLTIACGQPEACVRLMAATQIAAWPSGDNEENNRGDHVCGTGHSALEGCVLRH